jgi:hypothetical protein
MYEKPSVSTPPEIGPHFVGLVSSLSTKLPRCNKVQTPERLNPQIVFAAQNKRKREWNKLKD